LLTFASGALASTGNTMDLLVSNQICYARGSNVVTRSGAPFAGDTFCSLAGQGAFTHLAHADANDGTAAGTVTACSCAASSSSSTTTTSASFFSIGFSLLAILAFLWK